MSSEQKAQNNVRGLIKFPGIKPQSFIISVLQSQPNKVQALTVICGFWFLISVFDS
jgi:hypothetical protein